jgi:acyl-CoA reductase-like NAD-dependent aldehyde dehydrogenase
MDDRLAVAKTYKLFIDGKFPRSESGRSLEVRDASGRVAAHASLASRKDLRDAVEAARRAQQKWADSSGLVRGQVLYRVAEMMEGKRAELESALAVAGVRGGKKPRGGTRAPSLTPRREVALSIDRVVHYAGWTDKFPQVLGCQNAVGGPYYNFTTPEPTGVVVAISPDAPALLALVSLAAPVVATGNACVALVSQTNPLPACVLAEALATGDLPAGIVNILTGTRAELLPHAAGHRDVDGVHAGNLSPEESALLRGGAAENVKRVTARTGVDWADADACESPWWIEPFVEFKTVWHPSAT